MSSLRLLLSTLVAAVAICHPAQSQIPDTLKHLLLPPAGMQSGAELAYTVAVDGNYVVAGAPFDDIGAESTGVVKVFDAISGALLYLIKNPTPMTGDEFGIAVAISGTHVVVGAAGDGASGNDDGAAYVYDLAGASPTIPILTIPNPTPGPNFLDAFGGAVAISGNRIIIGAPGDDAVGGDAGIAYVFDLTGPTAAIPVATLNNPAPAACKNYGGGVAIDGTRVVVSSVNKAAGTGRTFAYDLANSTTAIATLDSPGLAQTGGFYVSTAVAISGTRVVVGADGDDVGAANSGSAYVFDLASTSPGTPVAVLLNPTPAANDNFGQAVAISGTRILVGANTSDVGAVDAGRAYVFDLMSPTTTTPILTLANPMAESGDQFGFSVALTGARAVVGAPADDAGAVDAGSAYAYDLDGASPATVTATFNQPGPTTADQAGGAVAISGTLVVVGASGHDNGLTDVGQVLVYDLAAGDPTVPVLTLENPAPALFSKFGSAVAISGKLVAVAAAAGKVFVYDLRSSTPAVPTVTFNAPGSGSGYGFSVALSGTRLVVGAPDQSNGILPGGGTYGSSGNVYIYDLASATPTVPTLVLVNPTPFWNDRFGYAVAIAGTRVVVGANENDSRSSTGGDTYVFDLDSSTPSVSVFSIQNPDPAVFDQFGAAVAISGNRVVIGTPYDAFGAAQAGSAYVFDLAGENPTVPVLTLHNPSPGVFDNFGCSLSISGARLVIAAEYDDTGGTDAGAAYVFNLGSATPTVPEAILQKSMPAFHAQFGHAVAMENAIIAIGAPHDDTGTNDKGSVSIFGPASNDTNGNGLFDLWEYARFGTLSGHGATTDSDGDGNSELMEMAFDKDPLVPNPTMAPVPIVENGYLTLTIAKRAGVNYEVQSAATPADADFAAATTTVLIDTPTTLKVRDNFPVTEAGSRFIRVHVAAAP